MLVFFLFCGAAYACLLVISAILRLFIAVSVVADSGTAALLQTA